MKTIIFIFIVLFCYSCKKCGICTVTESAHSGNPAGSYVTVTDWKYETCGKENLKTTETTKFTTSPDGWTITTKVRTECVYQ